MEFAAIDFETADSGRDSACSVAVVRVRDGEVVDSGYYLMCPPRRSFQNSHIHGLTWRDCAGAPSFAELWPRLQAHMEGAQFIAAHNAAFDRSVLYACCALAGAPLPPQNFLCTVKLARSCWQLNPAKLPDVCRHLRIPLKHHDAESDAAACAQIVNAAFAAGHELTAWLGPYKGKAGQKPAASRPARRPPPRRYRSW